MKFIVKKPELDGNCKVKLNIVPLEDINISKYAVLAIDGSTSNSGICIMQECDCAIKYIISASREDNETAVQYKIRLKRTIADILRRNKYIQKTFYEEPVVGHITAVKNLFMLRTFLEEMIFENEPEFDYLVHTEVGNQRWKKIIVQPDKLVQGSENQKAQARAKVLQFYPFMNEYKTSDEIDATGLALAACLQTKVNINPTDVLANKKKYKPFKYNVEFFGGDCNEDAFTDIEYIYSGPAHIIDNNGIKFVEIGRRDNFEKAIWDNMEDDDKVLLIRFESNSHGNITLEHQLGNIASEYEYIYAIIWRKSRK